MDKMIKKIFKVILILVIIVVVLIAAINIYVVSYSKSKMVSVEEAAQLAQSDGEFSCIIVLGASVRDGTPSPILANRLDTGLKLYENGISNLLLLSGDNGRLEYNEVIGMKNYLIEEGKDVGLTDDNIYLDYAGFSTYDSMYRSKDIFEADRIVIATQGYHLYRALYIANKLGLEAYGVASEDRSSGQLSRDIREIPARTKDFFLTAVKFKPAILGDPVPLTFPSDQEN